jgi:hypothetical protein
MRSFRVFSEIAHTFADSLSVSALAAPRRFTKAGEEKGYD